MKNKLVTTLKAISSSKTTTKLVVRVFEKSKAYEALSKVANPFGTVLYQSSTNGKDFKISLDVSRGGRIRYTSQKFVGNRKCFDIAFSLKANLATPEQFKKSTELQEDLFSYTKSEISFSLSAEKEKKHLPAPTSQPSLVNGQLEEVLKAIEKLNSSTPPQQPAMDMDELSKTLSDKMAEQVLDELSSNLANEIMERLTRSDDFMNKLAETVGFKLSSVLSTRLNRQDESLKSEFKELFSKQEKKLTENIFSMFKESGWLK